MDYGFRQPEDYTRRMAQYMMATGGQQPDPYAKNGALVTPQSPFANGAPAMNQMMGAYMMKNPQMFGASAKPWVNPDTAQLMIGQAP